MELNKTDELSPFSHPSIHLCSHSKISLAQFFPTQCINTLTQGPDAANILLVYISNNK